jgi:hypothetical protein
MGDPVGEREGSGYDERESLRYAFLRVGLKLNDDALEDLLPQVRMIRRNGVRVSELDLSTLEPGLSFDARWKT